MDSELLTWIFFGGGLLLVFLEAALPGGVSFFLGVGGVFVAALRALGLLTDPAWSLFAWLVISAGLVVALRDVLVKHFGGEYSVKLADEDFEAMDQEVEVLEDVYPDNDEGRIRFRGAEWSARTLEGKLPAGTKATIKYRDNLTWIVEPASGYVAEPLDVELPEPPAGDQEAEKQQNESSSNPPNRTRS